MSLGASFSAQSRVSKGSSLNGKGRVRGIFLCERPENIARVWSQHHLQLLETWIDFPTEILSRKDFAKYHDWLKGTAVIFSTWGMSCLSQEELSYLPNLRAVFYAAGTVKQFARPFWNQGIPVINAAAANAEPVAEFTLAQVLFGLKLGWQHVRDVQENRPRGKWNRFSMPGVYNATVGIISLGLIGSRVAELLEHFHVKKIAYDPFVSAERMRALHTETVTLKELFRQSDIVTLHAPWLPDTEGMVTGELLASMKYGATFINTSRGALVREDELVNVFRQRPDLTALLDVTYPEPPLPDSVLYSVPNIVITPHIAGSMGEEVCRMADLMIEEFRAWHEGRPLRYQTKPEDILVGA